MSKLSKFAAACATVLCAFGAMAAEDFSAYAHKASIVFSGYAGSTTLTNFPALVRLTEGVGGFSYADCAQANGGDVRFTRGDGLELASECVKWDTTGESQRLAAEDERLARVLHERSVLHWWRRND